VTDLDASWPLQSTLQSQIVAIGTPRYFASWATLSSGSKPLGTTDGRQMSADVRSMPYRRVGQPTVSETTPKSPGMKAVKRLETPVRREFRMSK